LTTFAGGKRGNTDEKWRKKHRKDGRGEILNRLLKGAERKFAGSFLRQFGVILGSVGFRRLPLGWIFVVCDKMLYICNSS